MLRQKIGVVLFQLGGPDSIKAIEPFLYNLFCDPDIIDFPFARIARQPLARLIAARRAKHVAHHYADIGGKSPLLEFTTRQAVALERELNQDFDARVAVAMRYWRPFTEEAIRELAGHASDEVVLLPLYPQYSKTTTGSSLNEWNRRFEANGWNPRTHLVREFFEDSAYLESVVEAVNASLCHFDDCADLDIIFSAHSVPLAVIERGDPASAKPPSATISAKPPTGSPGRPGRSSAYPKAHETEQGRRQSRPHPCGASRPPSHPAAAPRPAPRRVTGRRGRR